MSLQLHRHVRGGRTFWCAMTAWFSIRFDGDGSTWYATIKHRDTGKLAQFLDRDRAGKPFATRAFATRALASAAAEAWVLNNNGPRA